MLSLLRMVLRASPYATLDACLGADVVIVDLDGLRLHKVARLLLELGEGLGGLHCERQGRARSMQGARQAELVFAY